ncbi:MAG: twin-arginine translocation pathway signal [Pseudomonadota bacterium]|nr:twin-arginine translocation pathway signal [Pseudomonadota bacterium]
MILRRTFLGAAAAVVLATGCASTPSLQEAPPIVFVHGNGDTAALWQTTVWRFESNGWPRDRLRAIDVPYPLSRDDDGKAQAGRTSVAENTAFLKSEVENVLRSTGAGKVVLMGNSRGGNAIRDYIQNRDGGRTVSHAILGGTPNHGVQAIPGYNEGSEFAGTGPFLMALNAPKNAQGDEVTGPVKWLTIRSDSNDKYAQPDGLWIGRKGVATNVTYAGPELKGATNIVIPRIDHRETAYSAAAFAAAYQFITGRAPATTMPAPEATISLSGKVTGLGVSSTDPASGNFSNNLPLPGAKIDVYPTDPATGERRGTAAYTKTIGADGLWGPFAAQPGTPYEFVVAAPGYATTHIYRSPFPRSSSIVNLKPERIAEADKDAQAIVTMTRPRGYLDPARDKMAFDGQTPPPGALPGAGVASSKLKLNSAQPRPVVAEFNGERVVGRSWPAAEGQVSMLEMTY